MRTCTQTSRALKLWKQIVISACDLLTVSRIACKLFIVMILLTSFLFPLLPSYAQGLSLKQNTIIDSYSLKLSDIFHGLPDTKDKVIGTAPRPGDDMMLNARTLLRIALATDLDWRPASSSDYVVIRRAATVIEPETITNAVMEKLVEDGVSGHFNIAIPSGPAKVILPPDQPGVFEISDIKRSTNNQSFEAILYAPSKDNAIQTMPLRGRIDKLVEVPVLKNALRNGDIIHKNDVDYTYIREAELNHDTVLNTENLIGKTPRRMITEARPIKDGDLDTPKIVERGETVTMIFESGPLTLTATGKALQNGARGDVIRVVNSGSSKTIEATVSGEKEVIIRTF